MGALAKNGLKSLHNFSLDADRQVKMRSYPANMKQFKFHTATLE